MLVAPFNQIAKMVIIFCFMAPSFLYNLKNWNACITNQTSPKNNSHPWKSQQKNPR
jgi:hypothetical protein